MRLNVCVNEMAPFGLFVAIFKGNAPFDSHDSTGGLSMRRDSGHIRYEYVPHSEAWILLNISCIFVHSVVCNRRRRGLLGILGSSAVLSRGRQGEKPCVSNLRRFELNAQVIPVQHNSYRSYNQGYGKGVPMAPRPIFFVVR